jgi:biotin transport system substrate-specific component
MSYMAYFYSRSPSVKKYALFHDLALILGSTLLIALSAQIALPLPFSSVPITGQTLVVLLTGALLGSRRGSLSLLAYLAEGTLGFPVFAGGSAGLAYLMGPTGGYLVGFIAAAFIAGLLAENGWNRQVRTAFFAMLLGNIALYAFGLFWLALFVGSEKVLVMGLLPFIPGDVIKIIFATMLLPSGWRLVGYKRV